MTRETYRSEALVRGAKMLRTAMGASIATWLADPRIIEVMLNPDGRLWVDRLGEGISDSGATLSPADGERIIRLVAHHVSTEVHALAPRVSAELPDTGERFEGLLPPVVTAPAFAIRKPAVAVFTLDDYADAGIMSRLQAATLRNAVATRANILVAGGTGTGKTTLTNALLAEIAKTEDRVVLIEDARELQCTAPNIVAMRTKDGIASLCSRSSDTLASHLIWSSACRSRSLRIVGCRSAISSFRISSIVCDPSRRSSHYERAAVHPAMRGSVPDSRRNRAALNPKSKSHPLGSP